VCLGEGLLASEDGRKKDEEKQDPFCGTEGNQNRFFDTIPGCIRESYSRKVGQGAGDRGFFSTIASALADGKRVGGDKNPSWGRDQMTKTVHFA